MDNGRNFSWPFSLLTALCFLSLSATTALSQSSNISRCPMDFNYIFRIPWNSSNCHNFISQSSSSDNSKTPCCTTLLSLFAVALAQYLKATSLFQLPDFSTSQSCLLDFQSKLNSLPLPRNLASSCLNPQQFVTGHDVCAGVQNISDWVAKLGSSTALDGDCRADLTDLTACDACVNAGFQVQSRLIEIDGNKSHTVNCFYFAVLYAAGVVNEAGADSNGSLSCILAVPYATQNEGKDEGSKHHWLVIILLLITVVILLVTAIMCHLWKRRQIFNIKVMMQTIRKSLLKRGSNISSVNSDAPNLQVFSFTTIKVATNNFSSKNKLGEGGFGPVYKGKLPKGQEMAVKRLSKTSHQGLEEFKNEVALTASLQHVNLVKLLGFCTQREEKMLIYEYMPNKSLDFYLFDSKGQLLLDWRKRIHIIEGITQGLLYLQEYSRLRIIHRDLKASNILLDSEMNPKIADFGLARIFQKDKNEANTSRIVGTYGYVSPEYVKKGIYSVKSDVYSFGVLLLQIISGKKNTCFYGLDQNLNLLEYAYELWKDGKSMEFMDLSLDDTSSSCKLTRCMQVALLCVQENPADRLSMLEVYSIIKNETAAIATPRRPAFAAKRDEVEEDHKSVSCHEIGSINVTTISQLVAR